MGADGCKKFTVSVWNCETTQVSNGFSSHRPVPFEEVQASDAINPMRWYNANHLVTRNESNASCGYSKGCQQEIPDAPFDLRAEIDAECSSTGSLSYSTLTPSEDVDLKKRAVTQSSTCGVVYNGTKSGRDDEYCWHMPEPPEPSILDDVDLLFSDGDDDWMTSGDVSKSERSFDDIHSPNHHMNFDSETIKTAVGCALLLGQDLVKYDAIGDRCRVEKTVTRIRGLSFFIQCQASMQQQNNNTLIDSIRHEVSTSVKRILLEMALAREGEDPILSNLYSALSLGKEQDEIDNFVRSHSETPVINHHKETCDRLFATAGTFQHEETSDILETDSFFQQENLKEDALLD